MVRFWLEPVPVICDHVGADIRVGAAGVAKARVVQDVESVGAELQVLLVERPEVLEHRGVQLPVARPGNTVLGAAEERRHGRVAGDVRNGSSGSRPGCGGGASQSVAKRVVDANWPRSIAESAGLVRRQKRSGGRVVRTADGERIGKSARVKPALPCSGLSRANVRSRIRRLPLWSCRWWSAGHCN